MADALVLASVSERIRRGLEAVAKERKSPSMIRLCALDCDLLVAEVNDDLRRRLGAAAEGQLLTSRMLYEGRFEGVPVDVASGQSCVLASNCWPFYF